MFLIIGHGLIDSHHLDAEVHESAQERIKTLERIGNA